MPFRIIVYSSVILSTAVLKLGTQKQSKCCYLVLALSIIMTKNFVTNQ
jgi:hypothetical protein